jgi:hypothetical protein
VKYLLLIFGSTTRDEVAALSEDEQRALYADWGAIRDAPGATPGPELDDPSAARTVRVENGETVVGDGPFGETALSGLLTLEADDLEAAIDLAARIPTARMGGAVEVRPLA